MAEPTTAFTGSARVGSAHAGRFMEPEGQPPTSLRVHGQCWQIVHDPEIAEAAAAAVSTAALDAQQKAATAQSEAVRLAGVAATEADEALQAALEDMVSDKSNVFIQDTAPVAEMEKPGVLWIDTTAVQLDDGTTVRGNVPKTWNETFQAWGAVTDSAVVQAAADAAAAHQAAQVAADAAGEAMAEARYAPRIADRAPTPSDGTNKPAGAGWHEYAETTNWQGVTASRLVQTWRWDGAQWLRLDMDPTMIPVLNIGTGTFGDLTGDRVNVTGTLTANIVNALDAALRNLIVTEDTILNHTSIIGGLAADEIAAWAAMFGRLMVPSANLIPNGDLASGDGRGWDSALTFDTSVAPPNGFASMRTAPGQTTINPLVGEFFDVEPGQEYLVEMRLLADKPGSHIYVELRDPDGEHAGTGRLIEPDESEEHSYVLSDEPVPDTWTTFRTVWTPNAGVTRAHVGGVYFNHDNGTVTDAQIWVGGVSLRSRDGAVLVEDGGITTPQLLVTEDMAARIADFMSVATKELIVTEDTVLNHARILGEAIVENINVTGKLVGTDGVFTGTVDFAKVNVTGELLAETIMLANGLVAGDPAGDHARFDEGGLGVYSVDPDGVPYTEVQVGPYGGNLFTAGQTTIAEDSVISPRGSFEQLTVAGQSLDVRLDPFPRGLTGWAQRLRYTAWRVYATRVLELFVTLEPNRMYRVTTSTMPVQMRGAGHVWARLRWTDDIDIGFPNRVTSSKQDWSSAGWDYIPAMNAMFSTAARGITVPTEFAFQILTEPTGASHRVEAADNARVELVVENVGPDQPQIGFAPSESPTDTSDPEPEPAPPQIIRYDRGWTHGGHGGDLSDGQIVQGYYPGVGMRSGGWVFSSAMISDLSGATIESFAVRLANIHWYYSSGGIAVIRPNDGSYKGTVFGGTSLEVPNWSRGGWKWVQLPSSWFAYFADGTYRGITLETEDTSLIKYGRFNAGVTEFAAVYRKEA